MRNYIKELIIQLSMGLRKGMVEEAVHIMLTTTSDQLKGYRKKHYLRELRPSTDGWFLPRDFSYQDGRGNFRVCRPNETSALRRKLEELRIIDIAKDPVVNDRDLKIAHPPMAIRLTRDPDRIDEVFLFLFQHDDLWNEYLIGHRITTKDLFLRIAEGPEFVDSFRASVYRKSIEKFEAFAWANVKFLGDCDESNFDLVLMLTNDHPVMKKYLRFLLYAAKKNREYRLAPDDIHRISHRKTKEEVRSRSDKGKKRRM